MLGLQKLCNVTHYHMLDLTLMSSMTGNWATGLQRDSIITINVAGDFIFNMKFKLAVFCSFVQSNFSKCQSLNLGQMRRKRSHCIHSIDKMLCSELLVFIKSLENRATLKPSFHMVGNMS